MKIYIIEAGHYEDKCHVLVTTNFDNAITFIIENIKDRHFYFNSLECWEDENQLFEYGVWNHDIVNYKRELTTDELVRDIEYHIENWKVATRNINNKE